MKIPLVDLQAQYKTIQHEIMPAIEQVLTDMQLFLGPQAQSFEQEFAHYCGCRYGVGLSNGTDALALALRACKIGPGDEVITVAYTFIATVEAIAMVGATPVFVDIDPATYTLDWRQLEQVLSPRTRAIIPVHLYGHPVEMQPVLKFAQTHGLRVIEDASQAHGATYQGQRVGCIGDVACFSFYCSKNLGAYGEAGICVTNDSDLATSLRLLRNHGAHERYQHEVLGFNARMDEMQAAVLRVKLNYLDQWNEARQVHAHQYAEQLQGIVEKIPVVLPGSTHVYHLYVIEVQERDRFRQILEQAGIATGVHYPLPVHLQPACAQYGYGRGTLPVTEAVSERVVSLPMYPELTVEQIETIVTAVKNSSISAISSL